MMQLLNYCSYVVIFTRITRSFFHKTDSAVKDFKTAKTLYQQGDQSITRDQYLQLLVDLGTSYERSHFQDKAQKTWSLLAKRGYRKASIKSFLIARGFSGMSSLFEQKIKKGQKTF